MNPFSILLSSSAKEKEVFYFATDKINSSDSHYFVCIKKGINQVLIFTCCTTQGKKREKYYLLKGYDLKSLVYITPNAQNGLKEETWIDCNKYFEFTIDEIKDMVERNMIEYKGTVSDVDYEKILIGLHASKEIAPIIKESFPNPEDIQ